MLYFVLFEKVHSVIKICVCLNVWDLTLFSLPCCVEAVVMSFFNLSTPILLHICFQSFEENFPTGFPFPSFAFESKSYLCCPEAEIHGEIFLIAFSSLHLFPVTW